MEEKICVASKPIHYCDGQTVNYYPNFTESDAKAIVKKYEQERVHMFSPYAEIYDMSNPEHYNRWISMFNEIVSVYPDGYSSTWRVRPDELAKVDCKGYLVVVIEPYDD